MNQYEREESHMLTQFKAKDVAFVCIGTDAVMGDSLGPIVGTYLKRLGYEVYGTLDSPVHALNLKYVIPTLPKNKTIIAIDASLGMPLEIGKITVGKGPIHPGKGIGKNLPPIGDYHIMGIVGPYTRAPGLVLANTRLRKVFRMAEKIVDTISKAIPIAHQEVAVTRR